MIENLMLTLLVFWAFGYQCKSMGLTRPHDVLIAILLGWTTTLGLVTGFLFQVPLYQILGLHLIGNFVTALPKKVLPQLPTPSFGKSLQTFADVLV